ncbi:PVC-type heme-binding CxxCH protein [Pirellulaceae bacterium SH501]
MTAIARLILCLSIASVSPVHAADRWIPSEPKTPPPEFGLTIRSTPHRTPAEELAGFHVPEGFVVDLIASEPQIAKPLNLAFDHRGRLWVTQTTHYPFPAKEGEKASDSIIVLEDSNRDGTFESQKLFANNLNIPIGLLPVEDGVICFSIPNIWHLRDVDGDGVCDQQNILYGPFDTTRDTHGMVNSLRDGGDGWIYACHGFNNQSSVAGKDGHRVSMQSGNIFRFRPDGSRIELYSQGQVNPFGMTQDRFGNWFSADCHSKPITQLLHGGCNPSFGRPDDGLGFVPAMMEHLHGSTAIAGLAHTKDSKFPGEMADQFLSGNVMTCRINRNQIHYQGATARASELPDLLTSEDSWFRPVDLVFGPDGHLYIADFYNKVIGHYEVPLDHPDRDRTSGRIWRIRWAGNPQVPVVPFSQTSSPSTNALQWDELSKLDLKQTKDAMQWLAAIQKLAVESPNGTGLRYLLQASGPVGRLEDPILKQAHAIALRRVILALSNTEPQTVEQFLAKQMESSASRNTPELQSLFKVLPACRTSLCTEWSIGLIERGLANRSGRTVEYESMLQETIEKLAEVVDDQSMDRYLQLLRKTVPNDSPIAFAERLVAMAAKQQQLRGSLSDKLVAAAFHSMEQLAQVVLDANHLTSGSVSLREWVATSSTGDDRRPWGIETRQGSVLNEDSSERKEALALYSSFPLGETYTGSCATEPFVPSGPISFSLAGHNGFPSKPDTRLNFVRLLTWDPALGVYSEVARAYPPRNDEATRILWNKELFAGKSVIVEVVDGDNSGSYAWIAAGNFTEPSLQIDRQQPEWKMLRTMISLFGAPWSNEAMANVIASDRLSSFGRFVVLRPALLQVSPIATELTDLAAEIHAWDLLESVSPPSSPKDSESLERWSAAWDQHAPAMLKRMNAAAQTRLVRRLAKYRNSASRFAAWTKQGALSVDALGALPESWWSSLSEAEQEGLASFRSSLAARVDRSKLIETKLTELRSASPDRDLGQRVFSEKCAQCHKLGAIGSVVGPQLEGIGNRGLERLCEDILWPDRNVDEAFRVSLIRMEDGVTYTGLITDRTDTTITLVDQTGKKIAIPAAEVEQEKRSELSLMPSNMEQNMTTAELASLLAFLQSAAKKN